MKNSFEEKLLLILQKASFDYLICVPTSGINKVYTAFEQENKCIYVTREEEGVALSAGLAIGNKVPLLLIQQSGVGNLLNAVFTLADPYNIQFPILVLFRGEGDENPIHHYSSQRTGKILKLLDGYEIDWEDTDVINNCLKYIKGKKRWIYCHY